MKYITICLVPAFILFATGSCKKSEVVTPTHRDTSSYVNPVSRLTSKQIICSNWVSEGKGRYTDSERGILSGFSSNSTHPDGIKVFIVEQGFDLQINSPFRYRLGYIWAEIYKSDLVIIYQSDSPDGSVPFNNIIVQISSN